MDNHDMLIADGREWAQTREAAVEEQLIHEDKNMDVQNKKESSKKAGYSRKKTASSEEEIEL